MWAGTDLNRRSPETSDLQSDAFDHSATDPCNPIIIPLIEPPVGLEPTTDCLQNSCSTN